MLFNYKSGKTNSIKNKIIELYLNSNTNEYYLSTRKQLKDYENPYIWQYIQTDVIFNLLSSYKVYIELDDKEYSSIYFSYPDYPNCEVNRLSKKDFISDFDNGDLLFIFFDKFNLEIILDMINGTNVWSYSGVVSLLAFKNKKGQNIYRDIFENRFSSYEDFIVKIEPVNDGQGLSILINEKNMNKDDLVIIIKNILEKYSIKLICS